MSKHNYADLLKLSNSVRNIAFFDRHKRIKYKSQEIGVMRIIKLTIGLIASRTPCFVYYRFKLYFIHRRILKNHNVNLIIGAGYTNFENWISTDRCLLDVFKEDDWQRVLSGKKVNKLLAEHVIEHFSTEDFVRLLFIIKKYMASNSVFRIAVPDGFFPNKDYIKSVRPGGYGPGADDHKVLYDFKKISSIVEGFGLNYDLIQYFDENGNFYSKYSDDNGYIQRSREHDHRNNRGGINYSSLIVDLYF